MATKFRHAEVFPPGDYIREQLEIRNWTQADLAAVLGVSATHVNDILNAKVNITADIAKGLNDAFGMTAEYWAELDKQYRLALAEDVPERGLRGRIFNRAPVNHMIKRNWIEASSNPAVLETYVCQFLGITSLDEEPVPIPHAARKATPYGSPSPAQIAWLRRVYLLAPAVTLAAPFSASKIPALVSNLRELAINLPDVRRVPRLLSEYGIRFLIVEPLPGSKIEAVTFWLDKSPVIAMSLRLGKLHSFWHNLLHEIAHVKNRDGMVIDTEESFEDGNLPPQEIAANIFAVETLIPAHELSGFIDRVGPTYSLLRIRGFASRVGVHPAIVIGQLAHKKEVTWARFGAHLPSMREYVTATALTDGWGHTVPAMA